MLRLVYAIRLRMSSPLHGYNHWIMPELPEIEVLRRSLAPLLPGDTIESVRVTNASLREPVRTRSLARVQGRPMEARRPRSKYLLLHLRGHSTRRTHLAPTGRLP